MGISKTFIANTVRVVLFAVILEKWGVMIEEGFWHTMTGLLVFSFALAGLMGARQLLLGRTQEAAVGQ